MKKIVSIVLSVMLLLSLCACGSAKSAETGGGNSLAVRSMLASDGYGAENGFAAYDSEAAAESAFAAGRSSAKGSDTETSETDESAELDPEKIIYSGEATLETESFDETLAAIRALIAEYGGFIESSSVSGNNYYSSRLRTASLTLRVPSERFETLMNALPAYGSVPYSRSYSQNISAQYFDTAARLTAYRAQEQRLLEMVELAETVSDLVTIEQQLTEIRYQIESLQSMMRRWDRQVSYSDITLQIREVKEYTPEKEPSYGEQLVEALRSGLENTGEFFKDLLLWLLEALPALVILTVLFFLFRPLLKKLCARRKEKKARKLAAKAETEKK